MGFWGGPREKKKKKKRRWGGGGGGGLPKNKLKERRVKKWTEKFTN